MKCLKPVDRSGTLVPCGNCRFCRIHSQKTWAARILLEAYFHPKSIFCTLTYDDDHVPRDQDGVQQLCGDDFDRFTRRFRDLTRSEKPLRYFGVGEYGSETWRPHYHLILFGHGVDQEANVNLAWQSSTNSPQRGFTQVAPLTFDRAMYTAQYTLKKMTKWDDDKLQGRVPEFSKSSTGRGGTGGIGAPAVGWLADTMGKALIVNGEPSPMLKVYGDVFSTVRIEGKILPLGRYMRRKLRDALGLSQDARERAEQLGRFDVNGDIVPEPQIPSEFGPAADLSDINTPWRRYAEKAQALAKQAKTEKAGEKHYRQQKLNITTGERI